MYKFLKQLWLDFVFVFQHGKTEEIPEVPQPVTHPAQLPETPTSSVLLYEKAKSLLGTQVVALGQAEFGCAVAVNAIYARTFGTPIGGGASTFMLYNALMASPEFVQISKPEKGAIIISPTGFGKYAHGHTGICGIHGIMSNDSATGKWQQNYTFEGWITYFQTKGGFPVRYFKRV